MADERIDIEVIDKVAKTIRPEILGIAAAAKAANPAITKLKSSLSGFSGLSQFRRMTTDATALATATTKLSAAQVKAQLSSDKLSASAAKLALAEERIATQKARTAEAQTKANIAYLNEERALSNALLAEERLIAVKERRERQASSSAASTARETAAIEASTRAAAANAAVGGNKGLANYSYGGGSRYVKEIGENAKISAHHLQNLNYQIHDIAVSLYSGQKPMTVFAQQGAQIQQISSQAGVSLKELGLAALSSMGLVKTASEAGAAAAYASAAAKAANIEQAVATVAANIAAAETEIALATAEATVATTATATAAAQARLTAANAALAQSQLAATVTTEAMTVAQVELAAAETALTAATATTLTTFGALLLPITAVVAALGVFAIASYQGAKETRELNNILSITNNQANLNAASFYKMAGDIAKSTNKSVASVKEVARVFVESGRFSEIAIVNLTKATQKFAVLTGKDAADVASEWASIADDPVAFAVKMAKTYSLLSAAQIEHIRLLWQQGDRQKAVDELAAGVNGTLTKQTNNLGYLARAWKSVASAISDAWTGLQQWGAAETARPWSKVVSDLESESAKLSKQNVGDPAYIAKRKKQVDAEIAKAKEWAAIEAKTRSQTVERNNLNREGIAAQARLTDLNEQYADDSERAQRAIASYRRDIAAAKAAGLKVPTAAQQAQTEKKLNERYQPSLRAKPKKAKETDAEKDAKRLEKLLKELNRDLDRETARLGQGFVGLDATVADRMTGIADSIDNVGGSLVDASGNWTDYGKKIYETVRANERAKAVQGEVNRVYEETKGVTDNAKIAQEALNIARERGYISVEELARRQNLLNEAVANANDPLRKYKQGIADETKLLGFYGKELEIQTIAQQKFNDAIELGIAKQGDSIQPFVDQARKETSAKDKQGFLGDLENSGLEASGQDAGGFQYIIDNYKALYEQIEAMRHGDVESERNAAAAKAELDKRYLDARLHNTQSILGELSTLASSENKKLAAIGKAAAITKATIDAYTAINSALATLPPPFNIAMAAAIGATAFANVANIAGVKGFQKGGYTGDMPAHAAVGQVHGREYVMDAATTARIGVPALDAMRRGRLNPAPANDNKGAKVTVINNAGADVSVRERSDGELEVMVDRRLEAKFGDTMQRHMSQPNSKASQAVGSNFKVRRNR